MKVLKVINNNNLCVLDDDGKEQIVSGKGIGFGKKYGDIVDSTNVTKTYLITDSELQKKMITLLKEIPPEYMEFANEMVEHIRATYPHSLNESLCVTLSDHIANAIERKKQGIELMNQLLDSIQASYPRELALGEYCVEQLREKLGISMTQNEAGFIAMHIINARDDGKMSEINDISALVNGVLDVAEHFYGVTFDKTSVFYSRFVTHLRFLWQRLSKNEFTRKAVLSEDSVFLTMLQKTYNQHFQCAQQIREYILDTYDKAIDDDELISLAIHLKKMSDIQSSI